MKNAKNILTAATLASLLVSVVAAGVVVPGVLANNGHGSCPLDSKGGRTIVYFNELIRSDYSRTEAEVVSSNGVSLDAGDYRVTLVSFDGHESKPSQVQPDESWFVRLYNSDYSAVADSAEIRDLPSDLSQLTQVVNSSLTVSDDVIKVKAIHAAYPDSNPNSITPVCAAFDRLDDDTPPVDEHGDEPDVTTLSAVDVDEESGVLRGEVDPNGLDTDAWFEWGATMVFLNHDTDKEAVGDGNNTRSFDVRISGLDSEATYYYRAVAKNDEGTDKGSIKSFKTDKDGNVVSGGDEPDAVTLSANGIEKTSAVLRGEAKPNEEDTDVWFEWGTTSSDLNKTTNKQDVGDGQNFVAFNKEITGLDEDTTYFFQAVAENSEGTDRGSVESFKTDRTTVNNNNDEPEILDVDVEDISDDEAELVCEVNPNGLDTDVWFEWDEDEGDLEDGRGEDTRKIDVDRGDSRQTVKIKITGLDRDTRYSFRCIAENRDGEDVSRIYDFRTDDRGTDDEPDVTTLPAEDVENTRALLRGEVDPNGLDTDVWFEYGTSRSNLNKDTRSEDIGDGNRTEDFEDTVTGLRRNTTYYFRAVAESREGIDRGSVKSFNTGGKVVPPIVTPPTIITKVVEIVREVAVTEDKKEREALIITLDSDKTDFDSNGEVTYIISYENETDKTFTDAVLVVEVPRELDFVDADPREDDEDHGDLIFEIGDIEPRDRDSFEILAEVSNSLDEGDEIELVASIEYLDDKEDRIVKVIDVSTLAELKQEEDNGGVGAAFVGALVSFFTNPLFWILVLLAVIFIVYRYFARLGSMREVSTVTVAQQPPAPIAAPGPVQQQFPNGNHI